MKPDRCTLIIGAAIIIGAAFLSARQGQRPACPNGSCCPLPMNFGGSPSSSWVVAESTNAKPAEPNSESLTNRNP